MNFIDKLSEVIEEICHSINEKITGTIFLENLKFELVHKIADLDRNVFEFFKTYLNNTSFVEKSISLKNIKLTYRIDLYKKNEYIEKQSIDKDCLYFLLDGTCKIIVFDKNMVEKSINTKLLKNMGVVLSKDTVISNNISEKCVLLQITNV